MRGSRMALLSASMLCAAAASAPGTATATEAPGYLPAQFYGAPPYSGGDGWERRREWQDMRRERDDARIAEAARREAWRIEQERDQRRAWRRAERDAVRLRTADAVPPAPRLVTRPARAARPAADAAAMPEHARVGRGLRAMRRSS
jgi:hypothetical protein